MTELPNDLQEDIKEIIDDYDDLDLNVLLAIVYEKKNFGTQTKEPIHEGTTPPIFPSGPGSGFTGTQPEAGGYCDNCGTLPYV